MKPEGLKELSIAVASLSKEGLFIPKIKSEGVNNSKISIFINKLNELLSKSVEDRNRFRRLFPPRKIIKLADMIYSLSSSEHMKNYRKYLKF